MGEARTDQVVGRGSRRQRGGGTQLESELRSHRDAMSQQRRLHTAATRRGAGAGPAQPGDVAVDLHRGTPGHLAIHQRHQIDRPRPGTRRAGRLVAHGAIVGSVDAVRCRQRVEPRGHQVVVDLDDLDDLGVGDRGGRGEGRRAYEHGAEPLDAMGQRADRVEGGGWGPRRQLDHRGHVAFGIERTHFGKVRAGQLVDRDPERTVDIPSGPVRDECAIAEQ